MEAKVETRLLSAEAIRRRIEQTYAARSALGEDGIAYPIGPISVTSERGEFIAGLCRANRPCATLEVGMAWGMSTLHILAALIEAGSARPGCHVVIDPFQSAHFHNAALRTVRETGVAELIEFHEEGSELVLPRLLEEGRRFDFVFIDGDHRFDGVFTDFFFVHRLLKPGGIVIFDDLQRDPVYLACRFAETNLGYVAEAEFPDRLHARPSSRRRSREIDRLQRPAIRAYRKPVEEVVRDKRHFVPFFDGFIPQREIPRINSKRLERNRLSHLGLTALARGDRVAARRAFSAALGVDPLRFATYLRLLRTFLPARLAMMFTGRTRRRL